LTWEFKRALFCNDQRLPPSRFPDLYDSALQSRIQTFFDSKAGFPKLGDDSEYSRYFEAYLPDEKDRRRFLDQRLQGCKPSYGHLCLAALMSVGQVRMIWTTNFDHMIERACGHSTIAELGTRALAVVGLESPDKLSDLIHDEAWPLLIKLHGDFLYRKLKNTTPELQSQDATFRHHLSEECGRRGLVVAGYSGRDVSIMRTLHEALRGKSPFPHGLFWFVRPGEQPFPAVRDLLAAAHKAGVQAAFVEVNTFDEVMADLFLPHQDNLSAIRDLVKASRPSRQPIPITYKQSSQWPVLRTNAFPVSSYPATCSVFQSSIGNTRDVKELTRPHASEMVAFRRKAGVVAFGNRTKLAEVFTQYSPQGFDRYPIEQRRLRYDGPELGLLYHALTQGISNQTGLVRSQNAKGRFLFAPDARFFTPDELRVFATVSSKGVWQIRPGTVLHEGFELSLDYRDQRLWMLVDSTIVVTSDGRTPYSGSDRSDITRELLVKRYNKQKNDLVDVLPCPPFLYQVL
jgi:hypothetical protein